VISSGILLIVLVGALKGAEKIPISASAETGTGLVKNIGRVLFGEFLLPFEVASILFLAAMVGAVMLGKRETK
jgi:NADH-quinone oxidoreductase subunit J